jgi:integrase/recombinase XerD
MNTTTTTKRRKGHAADLSEKQVAIALAQAKTHPRFPERNTALILVSLNLGLRASEIAALRWSMVLDIETGDVGSVLRLPDSICKWGSGGTLPLSKTVQNALQTLLVRTREEGSVEPDHHVFTSQKGRRGEGLQTQSVVDLFKRIWTAAGSDGSSHSGRRYFVTRCARNVSAVGGSLKDGMTLSRHRNLSTLQMYIHRNTRAQTQLVDIIGKGLR